ncbi:response regulator [Marinobacter sp. NSM]|uniref:response regulator n=1 Tax=Marinobacter sp. NSM TaxID=3458004 RepID=UPI0040357939
MTIRVIIADDHELIREGMKHLLQAEQDMELSAQVGNGAALIHALRESDFDVVLMDLNMPGRSGLELLRQLKQEFRNTPIIVLSTFKEEMYAVRCIKAGASAYLCKEDAAGTLVNAIRRVSVGDLFITPDVATLMAGALQSKVENVDDAMMRLSDREHQILLLLAEGKSVNGIAEQLCLSAKTVSTYKARIRFKTGLRTDADIVRFAIDHKLIQQDHKM